MNSTKKTAVLFFIIVSFTFSHAQDIFMASYNGDLQTVKRLVEQDPGLANGRNDYGRFPLEMAAQTGQIEIVKFLLEKGADINADRGGTTALHMAAIFGGKTELIELLLEKGADINARAGNGHTPLNFAVIGKQKKIADLLLDKGGEINLENMNFTWLLYTSSSSGIKRIVDMALEKDVDFSYRSGNGYTLLHSAAEGGIIELAELLFSKGLKVEDANVYGQTPLHITARGGFKDIVELFLKKGADINVKTNNGKTPIHFARENRRDDIVEYLKNKGADTSEWALIKLTGKYLDQKPPGEDPVMFAPGIISEQEHFEHSCLAFSPDFSEIYWSSDYKKEGFYDIVYMKKVKGRWTAPKLAPFSENFTAGAPVFSYDGKMLYFSSTRPRNEGSSKSDGNIWYVEKTGNQWSEPKLLDDIINTDRREVVMSISKQGTLYFRRDMELFSSKQKNGIFQEPVTVDIKKNDGARITALFIAPDESYMLTETFGGGSADIYAYYKLKNGSWSDPVNLGQSINAGGHERFPLVSPDGKYLFFLRVTDGSDFYWVDANIIEELKPEELK